MSLLDIILEDVRTLTFNSGGIEIPLTFTDASGNQFTVNGWANLISVEADIDNSSNFVAIGDNSNITFSETDLVEAGAVLRRGLDVDMTDWTVDFDMSHGHIKAFIAEPYPDSTFAVIRARITEYV